MKRVLDFLSELYRRNRVLAATGWLMLAATAVMLCLAPFDSRTITGINPWIKPLKFTVSITIFVWTLGLYLEYVSHRRRIVSFISWGVFIVFAV